MRCLYSSVIAYYCYFVTQVNLYEHHQRATHLVCTSGEMVPAVHSKIKQKHKHL